MSKRGNWSEEQRERERELKRAREAAKRRILNPGLPPYAPRGPSGSLAESPVPHIHPGHELKGQSIKIGDDGQLEGRWDKTRIAAHPPAFEPAPPDHLITKRTTYFGEDAKPRAQYITAKPVDVERWKAFEAAVARMVEGIPALPACPLPLPSVADALNVLKISDAHLGMLAYGLEAGQDHDLSIGVRDLRTAGRALIDRAPDAARCIVASLGDFFHAQDDLQRTPRSGHKLDVDTRFTKIFERGLEVLRDLIDHALGRFQIVRFLAVPGNHDPQMAFMIAAMLRAWYRNEPRLEVSPSRKPFAFEEWGLNLIGFGHGPSVTRTERLQDVMVVDQAEAWGRTKHRFWVTGDIHHDSSKEYAGVTVYSHKILAPKDAWHDASGYRSSQGLSLTTYDRNYGRREERLITIEEVRDLQAKEAA